jgi:hypothetical protein
MIIVITYKEADKIMVSHGVDIDTLQNIILPQIWIKELDGAIFDPSIREYVLVN